MRAVSDAFLRTITGSHRPIFRATVCDTFQTGTSPTGTRIPVLGGDVTLDASADVWGTLELLTDATKVPWPRYASDLLAPYGNEIYVERGVQYSDAKAEWLGLGYFRIDTPEQDNPPYELIRITGQDRMAGIKEALLTEPRQYGITASVGFIVADLVTEVYPEAVIEWDDDTDETVITRPLVVEDDRYRFLDDLIRSLGKIWHWDHRGVLVIRSIPDPTTPVWEVEAGPGGALVEMSRRLSRRGVYNAVVASGEGADTGFVARGVAFDNNPDSPTYYFGRFGKVPKFLTSPLIFSNRQAREAAAAQLLRNLGLPYSIDLTAIPNPALVPYDPIRVRPHDREATETHVVETISIPLTPDEEMPVTSREQTVVLIGSV